MLETDYAWLAGIIDGEGSLFVSKVVVPLNRRGFMYRAQISVTNTNEPMIRRVKEIIGLGSVSYIAEHRGEWKDKYQYTAYGGAIRSILPSVLPYLIAKRTLAEKVLELLTLYSQGTKNSDFERVEKLYFEIKTLNTKGKLVPAMPTKVN